MRTRQPSARPVALVGEGPPEDAFGFGAVFVEYRGEVRCVGLGNPYRPEELVALADELDVDPDTARDLWEWNAVERQIAAAESGQR